MRRYQVLLAAAALAVLSLPAAGQTAKRMTVAELEHLLDQVKAKPDAEAAKRLTGVELSERLSSVRLGDMEAGLAGEHARQALVAVADASAFLAPPPSEIPGTAAPDRAAQQHMMARTVDYLAKTLPLLPNLFAARDTVRFESRPTQMGDAATESNPLRMVAKSRVRVLYRNGREYVDAGVSNDSKAQEPDKGLTTWGEFGPIMGTVFLDAAKSKLEWSHWELGASGPEAVFRYAVPRERSHYDVRFCCVTETNDLGAKVVTERTGYHGEMTVDPDSGTILRLTVVADMGQGNPMGRAAIAVEYGPQDIGGKTYICPVRGIALAESPDLKSVHRALLALNPPAGATSAATLPELEKASLSAVAAGPQQLLLNDVAFREFHLFRAEAKMYAETGPDTALAAQPAGGAAPATAGTEVDASTLAAQPPAANASTRVEIAIASEPASPAGPVFPEMTVTPASGLPETPAQSPGSPDSGVLLHMNARLVDVSLVALDKKGRPVTNLKPEDLEVFDEGQKVQVRSFAQAAAEGLEEPKAPAEPGVPAVHHAYSNRGLAEAGKPSTAQPANTIILLIDANLSFDDLSNVREQMARFLRGLHENERVAICSLRIGGFQTIAEPSTDHEMLAAKLAKWVPPAQNLSAGQEQEARNRQSMEYVENVESLLNVNGGAESDTAINGQPLGASLRTLGDDPGRDALAGMVLFARYLAAVPGHKSLVWIASDNVLADWTNASLNIDKGSHFVQPQALRAQEAMNDAHVSVYPLDASRLEAGGVDASIGTRNVELSPTATTDPRILAPVLGPEASAGRDLNLDQARSLQPGRALAQMQQDTHSIQGVYREIADATGGRVFRRASDITMELNGVASDGRATYLLSFTPAGAADGKYHMISVKAPGRKDLHLQYRTGFFYRQEPESVKDRFKEAATQPQDATGIAIAADPVPGSDGRAMALTIAATDLAMAQKDGFWADKLDVYLVARDRSGKSAKVTGQTMGLRLKPGTYQKYLREGIPFNQTIEPGTSGTPLRIVVLDENSGRMGSVTFPATAAKGK